MIKIRKGTRGFTLIELLIVIAIIGILAAIAIPAYTGYTKKSKVSGVVNAMGAVKNAVMAYYTEKGSVQNLNITATPQNQDALKNELGVTFPFQYTTQLTVVGGADGKSVDITATLNKDKVGVEGNVILKGTNLDSTPTWTWDGSTNDVKALLPKG